MATCYIRVAMEKIMINEQEITFVSLEELGEFEQNLEYNPFDTTGCGYLEEDFVEFLVEQYQEASDYYGIK